MKIKFFNLVNLPETMHLSMLFKSTELLNKDEIIRLNEVSSIQYLSGEELDSICKKYNITSHELDLDENLTFEEIVSIHFNDNRRHSPQFNRVWVDKIYKSLIPDKIELNLNLPLKEIKIHQGDTLFYYGFETDLVHLDDPQNLK
jgi:hypothetical protein